MVLCQDEHLDDISSALDRLGKVAIVINDEVDDQNRCVRCAMCWWLWHRLRAQRTGTVAFPLDLYSRPMIYVKTGVCVCVFVCVCACVCVG